MDKNTKQWFTPLMFTLLAVMLPALTLQADFIRSPQVNLLEKPQFKSKQLATLNKGDEVTVLQENGYWMQIRFKEVSGWVSRLSVTDTMRQSKLAGLPVKKDAQPPRKSVRLRVARAAVGVKGLRGSQVEKIEERYNMAALKKMEGFVVDEAIATKFIEDYQENN